MDWKLEVVPVPVSDVDRAKRFYSEQAGFFVVDLDTRIGDGSRLVQLTPPGSGCSIHLNTGLRKLAPGSLEGLQIVVSDIEAAHAEIVERGVEASPVQHMDAGAWVEGGEAGTGTPSSSSATRTATAGSCRSAPVKIRSPKGG